MTIDKTAFELILTQVASSENVISSLEQSVDEVDTENTFTEEFLNLYADINSIKEWANHKILEADQETVMNGFLSELKVVFDKYSAKLEVGSSTEGYGVDYGNASPDGGVRLTATLDGVTATKEISKVVIVSGDLV